MTASKEKLLALADEIKMNWRIDADQLFSPADAQIIEAALRRAAQACDEVVAAIDKLDVAPSAPSDAVREAIDPWVDTRLVTFDATIVFGHGGLDFDRWEGLRSECHTRHGSFAIWKSGRHSWSIYGGKYGLLALDRYSSERQAKEEVSQLLLSYDNEAEAVAPALTASEGNAAPGPSEASSQAGVLAPSDAVREALGRRLDACRENISALRERHRQKMNRACDAAEKAAAEGDMSVVSINSTESERHREAFSALNAAINIFDSLYDAALTASEGNAAPESGDNDLCDDCPPVGYPTDKMRCLPCPRRMAIQAGVETATPVSQRQTCERCCGNGEIVTNWDTYLHPINLAAEESSVAECPDCDGEGSVHPGPVPSATPASSEPVGHNWKLSDDAKKRIAEIDDNIRHAALNSGNIIAGGMYGEHTPVTVRASTVDLTPAPSGNEALLNNLREAWSALAMIRETVETLGPVGAMQASEHLPGPTFMHEAEAIVAGIRAAVAASAKDWDAAIDTCAKIAEQFGIPYALNTNTGAMMFRAVTEKIATAIRELRKDPNDWEPCSPAYLAAGGKCSAPRVWNEKEKNHYHPKLAALSTPAPAQQAVDVDAVAKFLSENFYVTTEQSDADWDDGMLDWHKKIYREVALNVLALINGGRDAG